mgnify:CR=1 FL=1
MPTALQFRRGTTSQNNSFTGVVGELTVDTDLDTIRVHDGSTAGGFALVQAAATQTLTNKTLTSPTINGGTFSGTFTGTISPGQVTTNSIVSNGSNADISIQPSGTGDVILSALRVNGTTLDSSDSTKITIAENVDVTGTLTVSGALASSTSLALATGATVTGIADEDNMASNSATLLATQQSIKAYVDTQLTAEDLDFQADSGGALSIDLDSETMTFTGGTGIDTSGSGNAVTFAIDSTVATLTGSQTLTNKTITSPTISTPTVTGTLTATSVTTNDIVSNGSNADITIDPTGTGDINLTAGADVNLPANIGMTFGDDGEKIEGNGTDLTIASSNDLHLTATTDINVPANVGMTFGDDGEKIEGDGTNLTISSSGTLTISNTGTMSISGALSISGTTTMLDGLTAESIITNSITSNGSNADLSLQPSGTGDVLISSLRVNGTTLDSSDSTKITIAEALDVTGALVYSGFTMPTTDGSDGQAIVTDGSKTLSFATVSTDANASDDTTATAVTQIQLSSSAKTIDSFYKSYQDSALYYCVSKDYNEDCVNVQKVSICHNDSDAFVSAVGVKSAANSAGTDMVAFTAALTNDIVQLKAAAPNAAGGAISFLQFGLGDNTSTGTSGNVIISQNTDVDSASESLVSFAHGTYRGAKLFISINNNSKTEVGNMEALVVHDGSDAYILNIYGIQSGNDPLLTLTAAISGSDVVVSAAGMETNLRVTVSAIMLKDTMTATGTQYDNILGIAPVTVSSTATEISTMAADSWNGAVYYCVSKNASEGSYAVNEVFLALGPGEATVAMGPWVSTKGTNQLDFTAEYKSTAKNTGSLLASSTSGGSTTVSAYRINCLAK